MPVRPAPVYFFSFIDFRASSLLLDKVLEATSGFEPLNKGFADLPLTTWVRRRQKNESEK
jgi:hypothetical protein